MGFKQREGRRRGAREMSVYDEGKGLVARLPEEAEEACGTSARR